MYQAARQQTVGNRFGSLTETAKGRIRGHLHQAPALHPIFDQFQLFLQKQIALGMRHNGPQSGGQHAAEDLGGGFRHHVIGKFH